MIELIVNENAKTGRKQSAAELVQGLLDKEGVPYHLHITGKKGDARRLARELSMAEGEKTIWVVGGDGTLNEAVNGLTINSSLTFGVIPSGSGNDYVRGIGYPKKTEECVRALLKAEAERKRKGYDVGRIDLLDGVRLEKPDTESEKKELPEGIYISGVTAGMGFDESFVAHTDPGVSVRFAGSSGAGYDARVCYEVNHSRLKKVLNRLHVGKLVYYMIALRQVFRNPRTGMTILLDGVSRTYTDVIFACFMMTPFEGGGLKMVPSADPTDGKVSVCLAYGLSPWKVLLYLPLLMSGRHVKKKNVDCFTVKTVEVYAGKPQYIHTDGEVEYKSSHFIISCEENQVSMYDVQQSK